MTSHSQLQQQIIQLANIKLDDQQVISCYLDMDEELAELESYIRDGVINQLRGFLSQVQLAELDSEIDTITTKLQRYKSSRCRGIALFFAVGSRVTLLSALPFAVPFRNRISIAASPDLLPLIELKELYGRFMFVLARPTGLQLVEVNLGNICLKAWIPNASPGDGNNGDQPLERLSPAAGENLSRHSGIMERLLKKEGYCPFFLAGDANLLRALRQSLSQSSLSRLRGSIVTDSTNTLQKTAARCLRALLRSKANRARDTSARVVQGMSKQRRAVAGIAASLHALRSGIVDTLVIAEGHSAPTCWNCGAHLVSNVHPFGQCARCRSDSLSDPRLELLRLAGQHRVPVEFTDSPELRSLGGVGCLLHKSVKEFAQPYPASESMLDLVA